MYWEVNLHELPFAAQRQALRFGRFNVPIRVVDAIIFGLKFGTLFVQLIAAVVLVSQATNAKVYIPLGVLAFACGLMEGAMAYWRRA